MSALASIFRRELGGYFATPVAYVFIIIFLILCGVFTFAEGLGSFFQRGQADLRPFFNFLPWLYLFLIPALSMRLWAEERRGGTIELLFTLPVPVWAAVGGKYLAAWAFTTIALALTFPMWWTVNWLGSPDNAAIATGYLGGVLMGGAFLAVGAAVSATTKSQVIAFVISVVISFAFLLIGFDTLLSWLRGWLSPGLLEAIAGLSFLTNFEALGKGVVPASSVLFFLTLIGVSLVINTIVLETNKAD